MIKFKQVSLQLMSAFLLGMLAFSASAQAMPEPQAL
ncbi:MAG TPA: toluene tolerance protein, partial [Methylophaga sp.]|nr:toluene tolerance protein [Methylophaga sp.]